MQVLQKKFEKVVDDSRKFIRNCICQLFNQKKYLIPLKDITYVFQLEGDESRRQVIIWKAYQNVFDNEMPRFPLSFSKDPKRIYDLVRSTTGEKEGYFIDQFNYQFEHNWTSDFGKVQVEATGLTGAPENSNQLVLLIKAQNVITIEHEMAKYVFLTKYEKDMFLIEAAHQKTISSIYPWIPYYINLNQSKSYKFNEADSRLVEIKDGDDEFDKVFCIGKDESSAIVTGFYFLRRNAVIPTETNVIFYPKYVEKTDGVSFMVMNDVDLELLYQVEGTEIITSVLPSEYTGTKLEYGWLNFAAYGLPELNPGIKIRKIPAPDPIDRDGYIYRITERSHDLTFYLNTDFTKNEGNAVKLIQVETELQTPGIVIAEEDSIDIVSNVKLVKNNFVTKLFADFPQDTTPNLSVFQNRMIFGFSNRFERVSKDYQEYLYGARYLVFFDNEDSRSIIDNSLKSFEEVKKECVGNDKSMMEGITLKIMVKHTSKNNIIYPKGTRITIHSEGKGLLKQIITSTDGPLSKIMLLSKNESISNYMFLIRDRKSPLEINAQKM
jgi:hypothetical protein